MTMDNGRIVSCTMAELHWVYLDEDWDELYSWDEFVKAMITSGVRIVEDT